MREEAWRRRAAAWPAALSLGLALAAAGAPNARAQAVATEKPTTHAKGESETKTKTKTKTKTAPGAPWASRPGASFRVPYRLTETHHFLVRARVNGKGPFNFLVDSGAPALFVATETARKIGLKADRQRFWTPIDRLEIEGGARLEHLKARVEDPYQLVGMNALGLPGATIDGILGFTVLGRFRLEIDPTSDRMTWTRLDFVPPDPPAPPPGARAEDRAPAGVRAMNALGPLAKGLAFLIGKQPEDVHVLRGHLGVEWDVDSTKHEHNNKPEIGKGLLVRRVLAGSPAEKAGLRAGDRVESINGHRVADPKSARAALEEVEPGDAVAVRVRRGASDGPALKIIVQAGEGL